MLDSTPTDGAIGALPAPATLPPLPGGMDPPKVRFPLIDGLRGIAAMMVVVFHFVTVSPALTPVYQRLFGAIYPVFTLGRSGVEIFFVISGFVIAYSQRRDRVTARFFGGFVLRRSLRLDPPYWITIFLAVISAWLSNHVFHDRVMPVAGVKQILTNAFYVQEFLHQDHIVPIFWTLCLEVQFYVVFTLLRGIAQRGQVALHPAGMFVLFAPLAVVSVLIHARLLANPVDGLFIDYWFMFFLGVLICWVSTGVVKSGWFWAMILVVAGENIVHRNLDTNSVIIAAIFVYTCAKTGKIETWLRGRIVQFLGRISYSTYLLHVLIGGRFLNIGHRFTHESKLGAILWLILGIGVTLACSVVMYQYVERFGLELGKRLKSRSSRTAALGSNALPGESLPAAA